MKPATFSLYGWTISKRLWDEYFRLDWGIYEPHGLWVTGEETREEATLQLVDRVAMAAGLRGGEKVCDVGCGLGLTAPLLADLYQTYVTGFTADLQHWQMAQKIVPLHGRTEYFQEPWLQNTLESSSYDAVISIENAQCAIERGLFLKEAARVLKPGGHMALCSWMASDYESPWSQKFLLNPIAKGIPGQKIPTAFDYIESLAQAGFRITRVDDLSLEAQRTWSYAIKDFMNTLFVKVTDVTQFSDLVYRGGPLIGRALRMWAGFKTGALKYILISGVKKNPVGI